MRAAITTADIDEAELQVARCERNLDNQRLMFAELEGGGHDTASAAYLLREFKDLLRLHVRDRDRMRRKLRCL
jgi:hypothetical protein